MTTLARPAPDYAQYVRGFGDGHNGIDYGNGGVAGDIEIYAAHSGTVLSVQMGYSNNGYYGSTDNGGWGNRIRIDHGNGIVTTYSHLKPGSAKVSVGQRVARGQAIALMGNSGSSTGRHLHWELYLNGSRVDPEPYRSRDLPGLSADGGFVYLTSYQRQVKSDSSVNGRTGAGTNFPVAQTLAANDVGDFDAFDSKGESVEGISLWYRGAFGKNWFWAGAFTEQSTTGLADLTTTTPPVAPPVTPPVIAGATSRTPVYPKAVRGWSVPLGQESRDAGSVINRFIIHHTTNTGSDENYFKSKNDRSSAPTWYVMADGSVIEIIDPAKRPSATGKANTRSVAVETQNTSGAPSWGISDDSHEAIAQIVAWFHSTYHGKTIGGFPVDLPIDREHVIGHNEAGVNATACPGPSMRLDWIVARAKEIVAGTAVTPPIAPPAPPESPDDTIPVSKTWLQKLMNDLKKLLSGK